MACGGDSAMVSAFLFPLSRKGVLMGMELFFKIASQVVGGLGVFLLGMKFMSEGLQAVSGDGLRKMISAVTNNRFMGVVVGLLVTCLVQSSSVTTVMVVGFVNSGIMTLMQAIGVILGANIGTTITGWILVLKIGKYGCRCSVSPRFSSFSPSVTVCAISVWRSWGSAWSSSVWN
jgi:Na+/phosphate symporter